MTTKKGDGFRASVVKVKGNYCTVWLIQGTIPVYTDVELWRLQNMIGKTVITEVKDMSGDDVYESTCGTMYSILISGPDTNTIKTGDEIRKEYVLLPDELAVENRLRGIIYKLDLFFGMGYVGPLEGKILFNTQVYQTVDDEEMVLADLELFELMAEIEEEFNIDIVFSEMIPGTEEFYYGEDTERPWQFVDIFDMERFIARGALFGDLVHYIKRKIKERDSGNDGKQ